MTDGGQGVSGTVLVTGPTATGKSALALGLADSLPAEIVNADALQVYRGLDIGTAKPSRADRARVPHHLIDVLEPEAPFSAGEFRRRALPLLDAIRGRGRLALVVGGSGLYLRALTDGLSPIPKVPDAVRGEVRAEIEAGGLEAVRQRLHSLDPETAGGIGPDDAQRIARALEVRLATGRGLASWWREPRLEGPVRVLARLGLTVPRSLLYDRISRRIQRMVEAGWVDEVEDLLAGGCPPTAPAFQAIGYRQVVRHIRGEWTLDQALEDTARETRRFAKRQMTWFRRQRDIVWIEAASLAQAIPQARNILEDRMGESG
jgi:tRNA dimethylallyltransferase